MRIKCVTCGKGEFLPWQSRIVLNKCSRFSVFLHSYTDLLLHTKLFRFRLTRAFLLKSTFQTQYLGEPCRKIEGVGLNQLSYYLYKLLPVCYTNFSTRVIFLDTEECVTQTVFWFWFRLSCFYCFIVPCGVLVCSVKYVKIQPWDEHFV